MPLHSIAYVVVTEPSFSSLINFCVINPGANVSGNVILEDCCLVGANSVIHQGVKLAAGTTLGLGSALTQDTVENATYIGNPARKVL